MGADFEQKRVYVSATLKYAIGEKKYEFDLYNWGGMNIQMIPVIKNSSDGNHSAADIMQMLLNSDAGGSITVDIPTNATDIQVEVPVLSADQYRKAVRAIIHYTTAPNTIEMGISSIM